MPNYLIVVHRKADKFLDRMDEKTKKGVLQKILCLETFPNPNEHLDIMKIEGQKDFYRLRTGKFRVMFSVDKTTQTIIILKISQREAAYE